MLKREWGAERNGELPHLFIPSKTATLVPKFTLEDCLLTELQPWFLRFQWKTCSWSKHFNDDDGDDDGDEIYFNIFLCFITALYLSISAGLNICPG